MSQPKIVVYSVHETEYTIDCLAELRKELTYELFDPKRDFGEQLQGVEVFMDIGGSAPAPVVDAAADVRLWQVIATGLDHCEVERILAKGIPLANTPGFTSAFGLSECAMMYILMLTRRFHSTQETFRAQSFYQPSGRTLDKMTLGIIGFGASGRELAKRAKPFGMRIEAIDVRPLEDDCPAELRPDFYGMADQMDAVVSRADVLSLHLHLTPETRHIIDGRRLELMKSTALLVNVARGALVDEEALGAALLDGTIGGAGLDVYAEEPADPARPEYQLPNVVVTPHTSGQTDETVRRRCRIAIDNTRRLGAGEEILHTIDPSMGLGKR